MLKCSSAMRSLHDMPPTCGPTRGRREIRDQWVRLGIYYKPVEGSAGRERAPGTFRGVPIYRCILVGGTV